MTPVQGFVSVRLFRSHRFGAPWFVVFATVLLLFSSTLASAQWVEKRGAGWIQLAVYHHDTKRVFGIDGDAARIFADGHAITTSLYVTAVGGIAPGVDAWIEAPVHRLVFNNAANERERLGFGDVRLFARGSPRFASRGVFPVALRLGVKLPGGDFPVDAEIIPLGEGQRDWEAIVEIGHSFYPRPLYAMLWLGHRWREPNRRADWKPGDELFSYGAMGGEVGRFNWKIAAETLRGRAPLIQGIHVPASRRRMVQLLPSFGAPVGQGVFEVGARLPLSGRNLPAGPAVFVGYFRRVEWF